MLEYQLVTDAFLSIREEYRQVIEEITRRMGEGMAKFIQREVETVEDFDEYCHYVAGLVGIGLSKLFVASGLESEKSFSREDTDRLANSMGLFLQKTNIIRDYLEDIMEEPAPRMFWPREVWGKHAKSLDEFKEPENREAAVRCMNELINNALTHIPDCVEYMSRVTDVSCFRFCAIPQIMAIGTLSLCYNNGAVFEGVVKMRRGETAKHMVCTRNMNDMLIAFSDYAADLAGRVRADQTDQVSERTLQEIETIETSFEKAGIDRRRRGSAIFDEDPESIPIVVRVMLFLLFLGYAVYAFSLSGLRTSLGVDASYSSPGDLLQKLLALLMLAGVSFVVIRGKRI